MMEESSNHMVKQKSPLIVELIGPAGAGKTTLLRALIQKDRKFKLGHELELRKTENFPTFINHAPSLLPIILQRCRSSRRFTWEEIKAMVYLDGWPDVLRKQGGNDDVAVVLDHGAVFKLATLYGFGPESLKCKKSETWWRSMFKQWANTLDILVWLDAPDQILVERINKRSQRHVVKGKSDGDVYNFLSRYRMSFEQVLEKLASYPGPKLLQFDAYQSSLDQIVAEVMIACNA